MVLKRGYTVIPEGRGKRGVLGVWLFDNGKCYSPCLI